MCAHIKDPTSICRNSVGFTAGGTGTRKHCIQGGGEAGKRRIMAARFPRRQHPEFPVHCNGTRKLSNLLSNLIRRNYPLPHPASGESINCGISVTLVR